MTAERERTRPHVGLVLGLVLITASAVVAVPTFPLIAPIPAAVGAVASHLVYRRSGHALIVVLTVANVLALIIAGVIDLLLLDVGGAVSPPP